MNDQSLFVKHPLPLPLPVDTKALVRSSKQKRTLNDQVEDIYLSLYDDKMFQDYLYATYDEQAIEGSLSADNVMAAGMIRDRARKNNSHEVAALKLATISKCLGVVLRRYDIDRKSRQLMVGGQRVSPTSTAFTASTSNGE